MLKLSPEMFDKPNVIQYINSQLDVQSRIAESQQLGVGDNDEVDEILPALIDLETRNEQIKKEQRQSIE